MKNNHFLKRKLMLLYQNNEFYFSHLVWFPACGHSGDQSGRRRWGLIFSSNQNHQWCPGWSHIFLGPRMCNLNLILKIFGKKKKKKEHLCSAQHWSLMFDILWCSYHSHISTKIKTEHYVLLIKIPKRIFFLLLNNILSAAVHVLSIKLTWAWTGS